ncbi:MAG: hypothetical protein EXS35_09850 [Pedosphaera sp.]|nr:hypothetical protein [Pedosphaera sp.]
MPTNPTSPDLPPQPKVRSRHLRLPRFFQSNRYDYQGAGKDYIIWLTVCYLSAVGIYVAAHWVFRTDQSTYAALQFVDLNHAGQATIKSATDIEWFVGLEQAKPLLEAMKVRNERIEDLRAKVRTDIAQLTTRAGPEFASAINEVVEAFERGATIRLPSPVASNTNCLSDRIRRWLLCEHIPEPAPPASATTQALEKIGQHLESLDKTLRQFSGANDNWRAWESVTQPDLADGLKNLADELVKLRARLDNLPKKSPALA